MRIKLLSWVNLGFAIVCFVLAIVNFCIGNIIVHRNPKFEKEEKK